MCLLIPTSYFIPRPTPSPLVTINLFSISVVLFIFKISLFVLFLFIYFLFQFFIDAQQITPNLLAHNSDNIHFELAVWTGLSGDSLFLLHVVSPGMAWRPRATVVGQLTLLCSRLASTGTSAVAVARTSTFEPSMWRLGCLTDWFLLSHGECLERTGQRLYHLLWLDLLSLTVPPTPDGRERTQTSWLDTGGQHHVLFLDSTY